MHLHFKVIHFQALENRSFSKPKHVDKGNLFTDFGAGGVLDLGWGVGFVGVFDLDGVMSRRGVLDVGGGGGIVKCGEDLDIVVGNVCGLVNVFCTSDHLASMFREFEKEVSGYKLGSVSLSRSSGLSSIGT